MQGKQASASTYVPAIDGLRAIAVLSVLIYHWDHTLLPGGFTGVDVFFVISGYVISKSLAGSEPPNFREYILRFYKRRFLRIMPALLFVLLLTSVASVLFIPQGWLSAPNKWTAITAFFGASNFYLVGSADGYFSERIPFNPYVHTWSLAVEEQFYLVFPLIFYVWLKVRNGRAAPSALRVWALPLCALLSLLLAVWMSRVAQSHAFYLLPSRFWEMAAGAMLFQWQASQGSTRRLPLSSGWLSGAGVVLLGVGFIWTDDAYFPFPWALVPVLGTTLLIAAISARDGGGGAVRVVLESWPATYIGRLSYSLYLVHWPVFSVFRWTVGMDDPIPAWIALILTFALAAYSYHIVESRFRDNDYLRRQSSGRIVVFGLGSMAAASLFVAVLFNPFYRISNSVTRDVAVWESQYERHQPESQGIGVGKQLLVIGDSHAGAYATMVGMAANDLGAQAQILTRSGCSIARLYTAVNTVPACEHFDQTALDWVKTNSHPGDIVFLASLRLDTFGNQWNIFDQNEVLARAHTPARIEERKVALTQAEDFIRQCQALGLHVLIDAPKPIFRAPPFRCADWYNRANPICAPGFTMERDLLLRHREPIMQSLAVLQQSRGVAVWDPFPVLCDTPVCSAFRDGKPVFIDGHHLSGYGNRLLVPSFTQQLQRIWGERSAAAR